MSQWRQFPQKIKEEINKEINKEIISKEEINKAEQARAKVLYEAEKERSESQVFQF